MKRHREGVPAALAIPAVVGLWACFMVAPGLTVLALMAGAWMLGRSPRV